MTDNQALPDSFRSEGEVSNPAKTPVIGDGCWWLAVPRASDAPPADLRVPAGWAANGMPQYAVPRHGNRPGLVPRVWPKTTPLPGAVNVIFFDSHTEVVKLDQLWQLYWHRDYKPPARRPGLP